MRKRRKQKPGSQLPLKTYTARINMKGEGGFSHLNHFESKLYTSAQQMAFEWAKSIVPPRDTHTVWRTVHRHNKRWGFLDCGNYEISLSESR